MNKALDRKSLSKWFHNRLEWLLAILAITCIALGYCGYALARPDASVFDRIYYSLRLFLFNFDFIDPGKSNTPLEIARWVAPVTLAAGLLRVAAGFINQKLTWFLRVRKMKGHTIICGLGARGSWIARNMSPIGRGPETCVCVELNATADAFSELREKDFVVIEGSARNIRHLEEAGLKNANRVVIVAGDDQNNLSIAQEIHEYFKLAERRPVIIVGVEDYGTRSFFAERLSQRSIELIGFREQAALRLSQDLAVIFASGVSMLPVKPPELLIEASNEMRVEMVRAMVMVMQLSGDHRPVIHVCGANSYDQSRFQDAFPAADMCVDIRWSVKSAEAYDREINCRPDITIFALAQDAASLEAADRFLYRRPELHPARVIACLCDTGDLFALAKEVCNQSGGAKRSPEIISLFQIRCGSDGLICHAMDKEGRGLHDLYRKQRAQEKQPDPGEWEELPEMMRNSNRLAALQRKVWLELWSSLKRGNQQDDVLLHLSRCEHMRWMAFHIMAGWQPGRTENRNERALYRRHDCLRPFDELDARNKSCDLNNVLKVVGLPLETKVLGING